MALFSIKAIFFYLERRGPKSDRGPKLVQNLRSGPKFEKPYSILIEQYAQIMGILSCLITRTYLNLFVLEYAK